MESHNSSRRLPKLLNKWSELLASGEPGEIEARMRRYDGEYPWFLIGAEPFRDEVGNLLRWYGTSTDIGVNTNSRTAR